MDRTLVDKWVEALRSGEYEQGNGVLRSVNDKFCCLGVLFDVMVKEGRGKWVDGPDASTRMYAEMGGCTHSAMLPEAAEREGIMDRLTMYDFVHMNDEALLSFTQIANAIEKRRQTDGDESGNQG